MLRAAFGGGTLPAGSQQPDQWLAAAEQFIRHARCAPEGTRTAPQPT